MNENIKIALIIGSIILFSFIFGWFSNDMYREISNKKYLNGVWIQENNFSEDDAIRYSQSRDSSGNFICINIKGMTIEEIIATCEHESSHEIFARYCTKNPLECLNKVGVKNESN